MNKIVIEIERCNECPFFEKTNPYSTDGWDLMEDWVCTKVDKKIRSAVEWHEESKIKIPDWCPVNLIPYIKRGCYSKVLEKWRNEEDDEKFEMWLANKAFGG